MEKCQFECKKGLRSSSLSRKRKITLNSWAVSARRWIINWFTLAWPEAICIWLHPLRVSTSWTVCQVGMNQRFWWTSVHPRIRKMWVQPRLRSTNHTSVNMHSRAKNEDRSVSFLNRRRMLMLNRDETNILVGGVHLEAVCWPAWTLLFGLVGSPSCTSVVKSKQGGNSIMYLRWAKSSCSYHSDYSLFGCRFPLA